MLFFQAWGSCITRDALEFASNATITAFSSRESIVSACTPKVSPDKLKTLYISQESGKFARRVIEDDVYKRGLERINGKISSGAISDVKLIPSKTILIIDLTEERTPLLTDGEGHFATHSDKALLYSNLNRIFPKCIQPFSSEYIKLVNRYLPAFACEISKSPAHIVIHRAFFAEIHPSYVHNNNCLMRFYDFLAQLLPKSISIEVPKELRISSVMHKWGPYGLHMGDEYYKCFLHKISRELGIPIKIKSDVSVQTMKKSSFFKDSLIYHDILEDMYGNKHMPYKFSRMQYLYIVERELEKCELEKRELEYYMLNIQNSGDYVLKAEITPCWLLKKVLKRIFKKIKNFSDALYMKLKGREKA